MGSCSLYTCLTHVSNRRVAPNVCSTHAHFPPSPSQTLRLVSAFISFISQEGLVHQSSSQLYFFPPPFNLKSGPAPIFETPPAPFLFILSFFLPSFPPRPLPPSPTLSPSEAPRMTLLIDASPSLAFQQLGSVVSETIRHEKTEECAPFAWFCARMQLFLSCSLYNFPLSLQLSHEVLEIIL